MVDPHRVVLTGENSFIRLSTDGGITVADRVSHWRVLWSPAGQGHALFVESGLTGRGPKVYADNFGLARYLQRTIESMLYAPFADESLPVTEAEFEREGDSLSTAYERVTSATDEILCAWWDFLPPFVLTMPPGSQGRPLGVYSTFLPAKGVQLAVNDVAATGKPWLQDRSGKQATSCCLAWSETWVGPE